MIEATCAACGMLNRIAEADVPVGAKFVSCTSCKAKVLLPPTKAPSVPAPAKPPVKPIGIPSIPVKLPTPPRGVAAPPQKATIDLADLPAPKRQSPLAGAESAPKPAPRSALADAELPVPKTGGAKPPVPQSGALDLDDLMAETASPAGLADLPAPKPRTSALSDLPAPKAAPKSALADLPAPKKPATSAVADLPAPKAPVLSDLPAPRKPGLADLPAAGKPALTDLPTPKKPSLTDLPTPKAPSLTDLPAPKKPTGISDLPTPKQPAKPAAKDSLDLDDDLDLPMPSAGIADLPTPKPGGATDLPAPKGFFEDLPQPAKKGGGSIDLPAPKGFFDDLPQPAKQKPTQDLAPKGFFDDLPQPAKQTTQDLAPKGFFDDLPQPAKQTTQDVAPKGLFDDLPHPAKPAAAAASSGAGLFDDLQAPNKTAADRALGAGDIDLGPSEGPSLELDTASSSGGPELDLGLPLGESSASDFQDLDLSEPTAAKPIEEGSPIKIKTPAKGAAPKNPIPIIVPAKPGIGGAGADLKLDLAEDPHDGGRPMATSSAAKITPKKKAVAPSETPEARAAKKRRSRMILVGLLVLVALGGGGFFFYQRHAAAQKRAAEISENLDIAQKALKGEDPKHWQRAFNAADEALKLDPKNARANGIAAEAAIAGAIDTGVNLEKRIAKGRQVIQEALGAGNTSPELERAQAVAAIAAKGQAGRAVDLLKAQIAKAPKDGWLQLYLGWAQLAKGDADAASKAFETAMTMTPATKLPALYGQGQAKLLMADVEGAKTAFAKILEINKDHVCANIGLIATKPTSKSVEQVSELEAVLQRKDIGSADPRCVVQAHTLIGDVHRIANRPEMARQRYRDALKRVQNDVQTLVGLAAIELRDDKHKVAADLIQKALTFSPDHPEALLLQAELAIKDGKLPDAEKVIDKLGERKPPLPALSQSHLFVVRGRLLESKGQDDDAANAYVDGAKLAGELDLSPTIIAVKKLADLAKKATDTARQGEYRARATQLLQPLEEKAQEDEQMCIALGAAYLEAGDPAKAEVFLRRAVALEGEDPEAKLQLAKVLNVLAKPDEAITQLKEAQKLEPKRIDIALELAKTYQVAKRHDDAVAAFETLLALPDVPIIVRVDAGKYFARRGMIDKAAAQAEPILKDEPENPGGLYLQGEGLIKANKPEEAQPLLTKATDIEPDAQYLDALGRALELRWKKSDDTKYIEGARAAYERAHKADPTFFHAWLGHGKMRVEAKDWEAAILPLLEASKLDKSNAEVMYYTARAYYGLRNKDRKAMTVAAQWFEAALKNGGELPLEARADGTYMLGSLYKDLNKPADTVRALENATRLGEEVEKQGGKTPDWLTETYYTIGDLYEGLNNPAAQKRAFEKFLARGPKPSIRKTTAEQALLTKLKQY